MPTSAYNLTPNTLKGRLPEAVGDVIFVNATNGNASGDGTSQRPFSTLDAAISKSGVSAGDVIVMMPGHAETIASAGACNVDVAGLTILGLGEGAKRPTFTFSATASTITITAASTTMKNFIVKPSIDSVVSPIVVSAADCTLDFEVQDASSTVECVRGVLTTADADRMNLKLKYIGFPAGNACVNAVRLVGGNDIRIDIDFYGKASTAVVEFHTTTCTNVNVRGYMYNSGTTDLSKDVVDTAGSGTWYADFFDGAAGYAASGGSGNAIAAGDLSAIASTVNTINAQQAGTAGIASWPTAAAYANDVSMAEVLAYIQNAVRNGSGTAMATNKSIADALGTDGNATTDSAVSIVGILGSNTATTAFASTNVTANADGNILEREEYIQTDLLALPRCVEKSDGAVLSGDDVIFNITGGPIKILEITGIVTTDIGAGATNVKLQIDTATPAATVDLNAGAVDIDGDVAGTSYQTINTTGIFTPVTAGVVKEANSFATLPTTFLAPIGDIVFNSDAARTGNIKWYLRYVPLSPLSRVAAAA